MGYESGDAGGHWGASVGIGRRADVCWSVCDRVRSDGRGEGEGSDVGGAEEVVGAFGES